jgi:hypothetical protein
VDRTFQVTPPLSLEALVAAWIAGNYPGIPEAQRGPLADPDDDGAPNGLEYFFGGHPALADAEAVRLPPGMVAVEPDGRRSWVVIFALGPEVPDSLPWTIEQTASLTQRSWTPVPAGSIRRNGRQVELRLPITQASLFLRLRL